MQIREIEIVRFSIPIFPFVISTGTMHHAQNTLIRIYTDERTVGTGECSAFPMITGETQSTCFEMAKDFAAIWKGKEALDIETRMQELHQYADFNGTIKSAFDMALYDIAAKVADKPLYAYLGGSSNEMETDLTIGIGEPEEMAAIAKGFVNRGVNIIKIKLGKNATTDIERVKHIRMAVGDNIRLRIDANQGWDFDSALYALKAMGEYDVQFCEQPMRTWLDH
ncbi:MAG: enolase C-terminal domain-like protein, partial [Chitinophagaceae bacterium]